MFIALSDISFKLPIGVATMYKPGIISFILIYFIFIISCSPVNLTETTTLEQKKQDITHTKVKTDSEKELQNEVYDQNEEINSYKFSDNNLNKNITILFSNQKDENIIGQFVNVIELAVYNKELKDVSLEIRYFDNTAELENIINKTKEPGKIYIGPIKNENTKILKKFCESGVVFFSFASDTSLAQECIFLLNFFPKNEIEQLFRFLKTDTKVALLYPENNYGYMINGIIDDIVNKSDAILINRSSYKSNLSNVRDAIKELGKYELRKYELERQKQILKSKTDENSRKRLKKLEKFKTTSDYDFTHVLIADYGLNLLQVAPLLPYYDIDPKIVQFMGTGVMDDENFFIEPSLQDAIFPGVEKDKRLDLLRDYENTFNDQFIRISTLPYDLIGILNYVFRNKIKIYELLELLNDSNIRFEGVDGNFYFFNNMIERDLNILQIQNGAALKIN